MGTKQEVSRLSTPGRGCGLVHVNVNSCACAVAVTTPAIML